jgi:hypothetical protein
VGRWRTTEGGVPVDAARGRTAALSRAPPVCLAGIAAQPRIVCHYHHQKLLTYALGRGVEEYDAPACIGIVRAARATISLSSLVLGRRQHSISDEEILIITKKALPRRSFLRGAGSVPYAARCHDSRHDGAGATPAVGAAPRLCVYSDGRESGAWSPSGVGAITVTDPQFADTELVTSR